MSGYNKRFRKNDLAELRRLSNSSFYAKFYSNSNSVVTDNAGANVETNISSSGYTEEHDSKNRFAISDANTGEVTYTGPSGVKCQIISHLTHETTLATMTATYRIKQNGNFVSGSLVRVYGTNGQIYDAFNTGVTTINNGDTFRVTWEPTTIRDVTIHSHQFIFLGIS